MAEHFEINLQRKFILQALLQIIFWAKFCFYFELLRMTLFKI